MAKTPSLREVRKAKSRPVLTEEAPTAATPAETVVQSATEGLQTTAASVDADNVSNPIKVATRRAPRSPAAGLVRKSAYIPEGEWQDARAAYLADWQAGGEANSIAKWIEQAALAFAHLPQEQRATYIPQVTTRAADGIVTGKPRSYTVSEATAATMKAILEDDQAAGQWHSESAWLRGAMANAVDTARRREGGSLPEAPARLPARLSRS